LKKKNHHLKKFAQKTEPCPGTTKGPGFKVQTQWCFAGETPTGSMPMNLLDFGCQQLVR